MGSNTLTYDGRGNLATYSGWTYTYDAHNLLIQATDTMSDAVTQAYDPLGRCVKRTVNGTTNYYVYDLGWRNLADFNGAGTQINRYVCGPATNEIATKTDSSGNVIYYHTDGLGSITKLTNSAGALVEQYIYNVFGQVTIKNAAGTVISATAYANRFLFAGAAFVPMLGLYDLRCRFYSPTLGRFLQPDPIGHSGDGYNVYRYCGNNPCNMIDSFGRSPNWSTVGTGLIYGGLGLLGIAFASSIELASGGLATPLFMLVAPSAMMTTAVGFADIVGGLFGTGPAENVPTNPIALAADVYDGSLDGPLTPYANLSYSLLTLGSSTSTAVLSEEVSTAEQGDCAASLWETVQSFYEIPTSNNQFAPYATDYDSEGIPYAIPVVPSPYADGYDSEGYPNAGPVDNDDGTSDEGDSDSFGMISSGLGDDPLLGNSIYGWSKISKGPQKSQ